MYKKWLWNKKLPFKFRHLTGFLLDSMVYGRMSTDGVLANRIFRALTK